MFLGSHFWLYASDGWVDQNSNNPITLHKKGGTSSHFPAGKDMFKLAIKKSGRLFMFQSLFPRQQTVLPQCYLLTLDQKFTQDHNLLLLNFSYMVKNFTDIEIRNFRSQRDFNQNFLFLFWIFNVPNFYVPNFYSPGFWSTVVPLITVS